MSLSGSPIVNHGPAPNAQVFIPLGNGRVRILFCFSFVEQRENISDGWWVWISISFLCPSRRVFKSIVIYSVFSNCECPMSTIMKVSFVGINICTLQTFHLNTTSHLSPSQPTVLNEAARKNVELLQVMQKKIFLLLLFPFFRIAPSPWLVSYSHFLVGVCSLWSTVLHSRTIILAILRVIAVKYPSPPFRCFPCRIPLQ